MHVIIPMLDRITAVVDMRETVQAFAPQPVITQDNVTIGIDIVVYYQVTDPFRATYEVANVLVAMEQLAITTLRNVVGAMTLEETLTSRDSINTQLRTVLDEATEKWGVRVTRVELKSIDPPRTIQEAMEQQMRADRAKRATILQAEGDKQSAILRAEGLRQAQILNAEAEQQSNILRAEGEKKARALRAEGEAEALTKIFQMVKDTGTLPSDMLGYKYLEALPAVAAGDANKLLLLPTGAADAMGAVAGLGAAFSEGSAGGQAEAREAAGGGRPGRSHRRHPRRDRRSRRHRRPVACRIRALVTRTHRRRHWFVAAALLAALVALLTATARAGGHGHVQPPLLVQRPRAGRDLPRHPGRDGDHLRAGRRLAGVLRDPISRASRRDLPRAAAGARLDPARDRLDDRPGADPGRAVARSRSTSCPSVNDVPKGAMEIKVLAQQYSFIYTYPDGKHPASTDTNTLVVPVDVPVHLSLQSKDVIHDWWVEELGAEDRRHPRPHRRTPGFRLTGSAATWDSARSSAARATRRC